jgi:hypothetical protein
MPFPKRTDQDRLERHTTPEPNTGCLLWTGACYQNGYGATSLNDKPFRAHRFAWIIHHGSIPDGMLVLHKCDTPSCCEVSHLFLGTHQDNMADRAAKGRASLCGAKGKSNGSWTHPELRKRGEKNNNSKLTNAQRDEIATLKDTGASRRDVALRFGITPGHVGTLWCEAGL